MSGPQPDRSAVGVLAPRASAPHVWFSAWQPAERYMRAARSHAGSARACGGSWIGLGLGRAFRMPESRLSALSWT